MKGVFNPNIPIFASNSAEGLHFSAFHLIIIFASYYNAPWPWPCIYILRMIRETQVILKAALHFRLAV